MLIGEAVHDKYRGRAVGLVLTGWESPLGRGADFHKAHLLSVLRPPYQWAAIKVSLMVSGAHNGGYTLSIWLPYPRGCAGCRRQAPAAFCRCATGALIGVRVGPVSLRPDRAQGDVMWSAVGSFVVLLIYMFAPLDNFLLLRMGFPLGIILCIKFRRSAHS